VIQNGGFEQGSAPWQENSASGYEIVDTTNPHTGNYSAYLCGYSSCADKISQSFVVPRNVSNVTINYWWDGQTSHFTHRCLDTFTVVLLNKNGNTIGKLQTACNANATGNWQQVNFNATNLLATYAGQTVKLVFGATTSSSWVTSSFFVDDVNVSAA
jgi:kumamolisin